MKFVIPTKTLYSYTSAVARVINSKNALQILNNFLFVLNGNRLTITGSDVENALSASMEVLDPEGEGAFCLDAGRLVDLLKVLPDQPLTVDVNDQTLEVKISYMQGEYTGEYTMVAIQGDQYPSYQTESGDEEPITFTVAAEPVATGLENTLFAVGTDDSHPQMLGVCFDIKTDNITFVATDTRKLVRYITHQVAPGVEARAILPSKPANILKSLLPKDATINVTMTQKSASFVFGDYVFNCRFIKGRYPEYNRVIPQNNPYVMRVDRLRFLAAVRRVGVFVDPGFGMEKFRITTDHVELKSTDTSLLTAGSEHLDCEYQGPELVMGFSAPYLVEICNTLQTEHILLHLSDPSRPGVFCPSENPEGTDLLMLLMPMNVKDF